MCTSSLVLLTRYRLRLCDTGCATGFVRANLVHDNQWTGKKRKFFMINNSYDLAPVAVVDVDCPWYKGKVEALCPSS